MARILILSDIHGNISALQSVLKKVGEDREIDHCIMLGDLVDYGMHSNEVIEMIQLMPYSVVCNIWGNHEKAILSDDYSRFSSARVKQSARYTKSQLNAYTLDYLKNEMINDGKQEFYLSGKRCLAVHGSLEDIYWKAVRPGQDLSVYRPYDYIFSGHSHLPHFFEIFYEADAPEYRNKKKTIFINPGSVGQPRNHNPMAQFAILNIETEKICLEKSAYDITREQAAYSGKIDTFYRDRLKWGV